MSPAEIKAARLAWGLSQNDLGRLARTSGAVVSMWERKAPSIPSRAAAWQRIVAVLQGPPVEVPEPETRDEGLTEEQRATLKRMRAAKLPRGKHSALGHAVAWRKDPRDVVAASRKVSP